MNSTTQDHHILIIIGGQTILVDIHSLLHIYLFANNVGEEEAIGPALSKGT